MGKARRLSVRRMVYLDREHTAAVPWEDLTSEEKEYVRGAILRKRLLQEKARHEAMGYEVTLPEIETPEPVGRFRREEGAERA